MTRSAEGWAITFCRDYFGLEPAVVDLMGTSMGNAILYSLWRDLGDQVYESSLYLLREEIYRSWNPLALKQRCPEFFAALPQDGIILDYGCGTAEYARRDWYDVGGRAVLADVSNLTWAYLQAKYATHPHLETRYLHSWYQQLEVFDGVICLDVLEHLYNPVDTTKMLYTVLKPGGNALFFFSQAYPHPGHLKDPIDRYPAWLRWCEAHFFLVEERGGMLWLRKPMEVVI